MKTLPSLAAGLVTSLLAIGTSAAPFPSTYEPLPSSPTLIKNATVLTGDGARLENASLLMMNGEIAWIGDGDIPEGTQEVDATGRWVTPGLIDVHSHLGVYPSPSVKAHSDGNEATSPVTADNWAEHSVWPQDPGFSRALAGGVTSLQVLPGSANLFGGRGTIGASALRERVSSSATWSLPWKSLSACSASSSVMSPRLTNDST